MVPYPGLASSFNTPVHQERFCHFTQSNDHWLVHRRDAFTRLYTVVMGTRTLLIFIFVLGLLVLAACERAQPNTTARTTPDCVSNPSPQFTAYVTDLSMVDYIIPPMVISGNKLKNRSYIGNSRDQNNQVYELSIYAPVDSRLVSMGYYFYSALNNEGESVDVYEYDLKFEVSCEISYTFGHVTRLAENTLAVAPTEPVGNLRLDPPLTVKAGDLVAYTTGTVQGHNWDFVFNNASKSNQFTNQGRYESDLQHLLTADCPYDFYPEEMKNEYYSLMRGGFSGTIRGPDCLVIHEQPGSISGGWFTEPFTSHRSPDSEWALAIGVWADRNIRVVDYQTRVWINPGAPTYLDPRTVTSEHCYEHQVQPPARFVYLKLLSDTQLAVMFGEGACPQSLPYGYQVYYR